MNKLFFLLAFLSMAAAKGVGQTTNFEYYADVTFPGYYNIGDYIEFVKVYPESAGASGNYEISITYTRNSVAAAATFLASVTHSDPTLWREVGKVNSNIYARLGSNFTIDCNTEYNNARFRVRAVNTIGVHSDPVVVRIKIRSVNYNNGWTALNNTGNDQAVTLLQPMTNEWSLYTGDPFLGTGANIALKAIENGNVGIGTATPSEKLSVNGTILAKKIKVTQTWADYVFDSTYQLSTLSEVYNYIKEKKHLPGIPSAAEVEKSGLDMGEMAKLQQEKIEQIMLYLIQQQRTQEDMQKRLEKQEQEIRQQAEIIKLLCDKLNTR